MFHNVLNYRRWFYARKFKKPTAASCKGLLSLHKAVSFIDQAENSDIEAIYTAMSNSTQSAPKRVVSTAEVAMSASELELERKTYIAEMV